jgi:PAS domain S-box-containing protein
MKDQKRTKEQLIGELAELRGRVAELEASDAERKQTHEDLIRLSNAIEAATDAMWMIDLEGKVVSVNESAVKMHGVDDKSDLIGTSAFDRIDPEDRERALAAVQQVFEEGYIAETEYHVISRGDGRRIPVGASGALIKDEDDKSIGIVAVVRDITDRKRAEEALQESQEELTIRSRIADVFLNTPDEEMYGEVLQVILEATGSKHGVFGYIREDGALICPSMTRDIWDQCCLPNKDIVFPRQTWGGIWGRALIEKKTLHSNKPFHVPEGHLPIRRALDVPIIYQGESIGNLLVGNKATEYDEGDIHLLEIIAHYIAPMLNARLQRDRAEKEHRRAEEALEESEQKFKDLTEQSPNMIFINHGGRVIYANRKCEEIMGYTTEEFCSPDFDFLTLIAPESQELVKESLSRHMRREEVPPYDYTLLTRYGKRIEALLATKLIQYGGETAILGTVTDISERKQAEEALRESEAKYRDIANNIPGLVYQVVLKKDGSMSFPFMSEGYGALSSAIRKQTTVDPSLVFDTVMPQDRDIVNRGVAESARTMKPWANEFRLRTKSGETRWVRNISRPHLLPDNGILWNGVVFDITEHKLMEQQLQDYSENLERMVEERTRELRDAEERYRSTFEHAGDAILVHDMDHVIRGFNRRAEEMFGYKAEDVVGRPTYDILCPITPAEKHESDKATAHLVALATKQGFYRDQEITSYLSKDRKPFPAEASGAVIRNSKGNVIGFVSIYRDITERKRLEKEKEEHARQLEAKIKEVETARSELQEAQEKLVRAEKLAAIGELAGGVGHEMRNPLGAIKNVAYLLNQALEEPRPVVKEGLEMLDNEVARSERIITALLDFGRPRSPVQQMVSINHAAQEALFGTKIPEKVEVVRQLDESLPAILADKHQLDMVFRNIILNAIQAMPEGGRLVVKSEVLSPAWLSVSFADTGVGIPEENLEKLFEPLFTTRGHGVGLGLAIVKLLIELHGGVIEVKSRVGKGATFTVKLPTAGEKVQKPSRKHATRAETAKLT